MLNMTAIQGRISTDLAVEYTPGKQIPYCKFRVAVDRDYLSEGNQRRTDFLSCIAWKERASFAAKCFSKGDMVIVRGRLEEDTWSDREGNKRSRMIINVDSVYFGETKQAREARKNRTADPSDLPPEYSGNEFAEDFDDAQLPF